MEEGKNLWGGGRGGVWVCDGEGWGGDKFCGGGGGMRGGMEEEKNFVGVDEGRGL